MRIHFQPRRESGRGWPRLNGTAMTFHVCAHCGFVSTLAARQSSAENTCWNSDRNNEAFRLKKLHSSAQR